MQKRARLASTLGLGGLIAVAVTTAAFAQADTGPPRWAANLVRKQLVILHGIPAPYGEMQDRTPDTFQKIRQGQIIFDERCSSCHGWTGHGGGPEAFALVPAPADLAWLSGPPKQRSKPYMYWAIAEGGSQFESDMPAYKQHLTDQEIWAVIAYVSAGMPRATP